MLFDLNTDAMEVYDISANHKQIEKELTQEYAAWENELLPPLWSDPHMENVAKQENNVQEIRRHSLNKQN